jgi:tetratricopeptide (TPR) repeat protein
MRARPIPFTRLSGVLALSLVAARAPAQPGAPLAVGAGPVVAAASAGATGTMAPVISELASDSADRRREACAALSNADAAGPEAVGRLGQALDTLRQGDDERLASLLRGLARGGQRDADLAALLVDQRPEPAVRRALTAVCAMRGLARVGTTEAVRKLVPLSSIAMGALRPELFRLLRQLDEHATAALVEARVDPSPEVRLWSKDVLDALGKRTPGDTVQTTDDDVLVDVLHAYGATRDLDALPVVLSFIHSERGPVRAAARDATLALGKDAEPKVRATYAALTGERLPDDLAPAESARRLFEAYDHLRLREVYGGLDDGLSRERAGDLDGAIAAFDAVLARQPLLEGRAAMAPAYRARAATLSAIDPEKARDDLRRALRLEDGREADRIRAELAYLDGEELLSRGIEDSAPFEQALVLDPDNPRARAALEGLRSAARSRRARESSAAGIAAATGFALLVIGALALSRVRRARALSPSAPRR